nr:uncharacterized protein LOC110567071 [Aotus nancymaae]
MNPRRSTTCGLEDPILHPGKPQNLQERGAGRCSLGRGTEKGEVGRRPHREIAWGLGFICWSWGSVPVHPPGLPIRTPLPNPQPPLPDTLSDPAWERASSPRSHDVSFPTPATVSIEAKTTTKIFNPQRKRPIPPSALVSVSSRPNAGGDGAARSRLEGRRRRLFLSSRISLQMQPLLPLGRGLRFQKNSTPSVSSSVGPISVQLAFSGAIFGEQFSIKSKQGASASGLSSPPP